MSLHIRKDRVLIAGTMITAVTLLLAQPVLAGTAADCAAEADRAERGASSTTGGIAGGALAGAAFGAIVGDSSKAAGRGAVLGGVLGGVRNSNARNDVYKRTYDACMARSRNSNY